MRPYTPHGVGNPQYFNILIQSYRTWQCLRMLDVEHLVLREIGHTLVETLIRDGFMQLKGRNKTSTQTQYTRGSR